MNNKHKKKKSTREREREEEKRRRDILCTGIETMRTNTKKQEREKWSNLQEIEGVC